MNLRIAILVLLLAFAGFSQADANEDAQGEDAAKPVFKTTYLIAFSEYQLDIAVPYGLSEAEIIDKIHESEVIPTTTIQCTIVEDTETAVKFGRRVTRTTGKVVTGHSTTRQTEQLEIGTMLSIRIAPHAKGAIADISYTTSRLDGEGTDDSPPDVLTTTADSTQLFKLGEDRLLVATTLGSRTCMIANVSEITNPDTGK